MPQFDVYRNLNPATRQVIPYLLDLQAELLSPLATRVVAPLVLASKMGIPAQHLNLQFEIEGMLVTMSTAELAGISRRTLGEYVLTLKERRNEIIATLDFLFTGI